MFNESQLQIIDIGYNDLKIFNCTQTNEHLTILDLSHNAFQGLSCRYGLLGLNAVDLSHNNISKLPEGCAPFGHSTRLNWLGFTSNQISVLLFRQFCSEGFTGSFGFFNFSNNIITDIDTTYCKLHGCFLKRAIIDLSNNRITTLDWFDEDLCLCSLLLQN